MQFLSSLGTMRNLSGNGLAARANAFAPTLVAVVLVIAIAAQLASLVWKILAPEPAPSAPAGGIDSRGPSGPNVAGIVNAHLFGTAAVEASGDAASAPVTNLRLVLAGTLAGADPTQGWAIVGESAQAAKVYATGASLPGGAKLREVYLDRVILDRGGRLESLPLPRLAGAAAPAQVSYARPVQAPQPGLAEAVEQAVRQDPGVISEVIRPQPVFAGGQQRGYRLYPGRNRDKFAALGLMPGDLVTAINGNPLSDPNQGLEMLRGIGAGGLVTLTVTRNGAEQDISVDLSATLAEMQDSQPEASPDE